MNESMREIVERAKGAYDEGGGAELVKKSLPWVYNHVVRPRLPARTLTLNGVEVRAARLFDGVIPWDLPLHLHPDRYEAALVAAVREHVEPGNDVVIVGGGWGVTAVVAANRTGDAGTVTVFEGSEAHAAHVRETAELNGVSHVVSTRHAVVSRAVRLKGDRGEPASIEADELPECDVLEMDCEGTELDILENLTIRPRTIIVETHAELGAPPEKVRDTLADLSYEVRSQEVAEVGAAGKRCSERGVFVLTARRQSARVDERYPEATRKGQATV